MEITGVFDSIKGCVGSGYCFGLHLDCYLCHNFVKGRIISKTRLKYDIIFIESCQLSRVSYGTVITMEYFDLNNEWLLAIIGRISSCELVIYVFVGPMKRKLLSSFTILKRRDGSHISDIILRLGY